ncbi:MAG: hypothetical protein HYV97_03780 [Bdellovibrio sp.]|nr:hypothetical protein [Bdellovibrio sp.]
MSASIDEVEKIKLALHEYNLGNITVVFNKESARKILENITKGADGETMIIGDEVTSQWLPEVESHKILWDEKGQNIIAILKERPMEENSIEMEFKYLLAEQKEFCLISFIGPMNNHASEALDECHNKIKTSNCKYFILNFRDVDLIHITAHRQLVQMQHTIRKEKKSILRLCGIHPKWKNELISDGSIRVDETVDNIRVALVELNKFMK